MNLNILIVDALLNNKNTAKLLNQHHLKAFFYYHLHQENSDYQKQYTRQWIHNTTLLGEIKLIARKLEELSLNGTLLKGAHLLQDLYPDLGSRFLSDVDILINENEQEKWVNILLSLGYFQIEIPQFFGNDFKSQWCKNVGEIEVNIELHHKLFFHLQKENWDRVPSIHPPFTLLSAEDTFVHLCGHLAFQHTFLKLFWLFDIYFHVNTFGNKMDWKKIKEKSAESNLSQSVIMCLWCIHRYFYLDKRIVTYFNLDQNKWWHYFLNLDFLLNPDSKKINYFIIKHATKDHFFDAIKYDLTWFWHYKIQKFLIRK